MTFENQTLSEQKSAETRAGLIILNSKKSHQDADDIDSSPREFYNQTRKKQQNKNIIHSSQPQSVTQSLRGLTNVTRTLYDPNAPTLKPLPVSNTQPITTIKVASNPPPTPSSASISTNTQQQMQEFYQK